MPRKAKTHRIGPLEEAENERALDTAAGVTPPAVEIARAEIPPAPKKSEAPLLVADTREKLLYRCALQGPGISAEFFKEFTDSKELAELSCMLGLRQLVIVLCRADISDLDAKDLLATMRILLNIAYGENASTDPDKFMPKPAVMPNPPIPVGGTDGVEASLEKIRKLAGVK
jgi:hypothetical protein